MIGFSQGGLLRGYKMATKPEKFQESGVALQLFTIEAGRKGGMDNRN
jgi:hypothetical protein